MICPGRIAVLLAGLVVLVAVCPAGGGSREQAAGSGQHPEDLRSSSPRCLPPLGAAGYDDAIVPAAFVPSPLPAPCTLHPAPDLRPPTPLNDSNDTYYTYETMTAELQRLAEQHPDIVHLYDLTSWIKSRFGFTKTWQGRKVWGARISSAPQLNDPGRPKIVIEGTHHADEWMGFQTSMRLAELLAGSYRNSSLENAQADESRAGGAGAGGNGTGAGGNSSMRDWSVARLSWLVDNRDIWLVPMANPDGVAYDQQMEATNGGTPVWRKNCRDNNGDGTFDPSVDGVDINRNYPYMWAANQKGVTRDGNITTQSDSSVWSSWGYHGPLDNFDDDGDAMFPRAPDWYPQHRGQDWNGIDEDPVDGIDNDGDGKMDEDKDGGFSEPETCAIEALFNALDSDGDHVNGESDVSIAVSLHTYAGVLMWPWGYTYAPTPHAALLESIGREAVRFNGYDAYQSIYMYPTSGDTLDWFYGSMGVIPYCIEIGRDSYHPPPDQIDDVADPNVDALLYLAEVSDVAKPAFEMMAPSLDMGVPEVLHTPGTAPGAGKDCQVHARVQNATNLRPKGLELLYRVDGGRWDRLTMSSDGGDSYTSVIPGQQGGSGVDYYFRAASVFNTTSGLPAYAPYRYFSYKVSGFQLPMWGWGAAGAAFLAASVAAAWYVKRWRSRAQERLGTSVEKRQKI